MKGLSSTIRIAFGLAGLTVSVLLTAHMFGLIPDEYDAVMRGRSALCESIAVNFSAMAEWGDTAAMERSLQTIKQRNPQIQSLGVRLADGEFVVDVGGHAANWHAPPEGRSTETHMYVPVTRGDEAWGTVEVLFDPVRVGGTWALLGHPLVVLSGYVFFAGLLAYLLFLRRVLNYLNPSKVVPNRVRSALDTLAEGLLVLDNQGKIVLANKAFGATVKRDPEQLLGQSASALPWQERETSDFQTGDVEHPWSQVLSDGTPRTGQLMGLSAGSENDFTFMVNATPIRDGKGVNRGVLASFEDVTPLEEKKAQLNEMLDQLRESSDEIRRQNKELERLATRDSLTTCLNRRAFFEHFDGHWSNSRRYDYPISCVMVDIDHFKSINDTFGHQVGDQVLKKVAQVLQGEARDGDMVCRYGGEEFVVLLPHIDIDDAVHAADRLRAAVEGISFTNMSVTASFGVSSSCFDARDPQDLLEQADKCLYVAKRSGRNQVVRWDQVPDDIEPDASTVSHLPDSDFGGSESVPFQAVTALFTALAFRDLETAEHSRRVADLCVATAEGLMSLRDCYTLETAALLHDIGKVGVPDSILLKPGPLTSDEWKLMRRHDRVGVEIVEASFGVAKLTAVVANHCAFYGGTPDNSALPKGTKIPLGARILAIADAYDSMVSDRIYRKGRSAQRAFDELRRCAGTQFDPELVERFIQTVTERNELNNGHVTLVSKKAAASIGQQIQRLVTALDSRDTAGLQTLAGRLESSARKHGVPEIAAKASELASALESHGDVIGVLKAANELVDLCRATQRVYLTEIDECDSAAIAHEDAAPLT